MLFERAVRAIEAGGAALAWSVAAQNAPHPEAHLDVHWIAAMANPSGVCAPWLALARGLFGSANRKKRSPLRVAH